MATNKRTEAIDAWLNAHYLTATVRDGCIANKCSPETINRRERILGVACIRHRLKRESPARILEDDLVRHIRHMIWAPALDYLEEA